MASVFGLLNRLLPFATPGTPLWQDLVHLAAICGALYFAPQLQQWSRSRQNVQPAPDQIDEPVNDREPEAAPQAGQGEHPEPHQAAEQHAVDEVPDDEDEDNDADDANAPPQPGPAPAGPRDPPATRNVGAKKAKALARRDQRRAYHEFQRSQGDAQRARDAEGAKEREAAQAAERERRRAAEAKLEAKKAREREAKREQERKEWEEDARRRELVVRLVRQGLEERKNVDLFKVAKQVGGDVDEEWVEKILNGSGMLGRKGDGMTMITGMGWCVKVTAEDMAKVYQRAVEGDLAAYGGEVGFEEIGGLLQEVLAR